MLITLCLNYINHDMNNILWKHYYSLNILKTHMGKEGDSSVAWHGMEEVGKLANVGFNIKINLCLN